MIVLFTDFGVEGPYVGQMKAAIHALAPHATVIDLMHDAPAHDPRAAAYLFAALIDVFAVGTIFCAVVDPDVGGARPPIVMGADGRWFVGPGNGLFELVRRRARSASSAKLALTPTRTSATFHGRDLFAPAAAYLEHGHAVPLEPLDEAPPGADWPDDLAEIIYIDSFGNAITGLRAAGLSGETLLQAGPTTLARAHTFSDRPRGEAFWYENSSGLAEIAVNRGSARNTLGVAVGTAVIVRRP